MSPDTQPAGAQPAQSPIADNAIKSARQIAAGRRKANGAFGRSNKWANIYSAELVEYSPAEGGCYYTHRVCLRSIPAADLGRNEEAQQAAARKIANEMGLTCDGDLIEAAGRTGREGDFRKARPIRSAAAEVDCEIWIESKPAESETREIPHYE